MERRTEVSIEQVVRVLREHGTPYSVIGEVLAVEGKPLSRQRVSQIVQSLDLPPMPLKAETGPKHHVWVALVPKSYLAATGLPLREGKIVSPRGDTAVTVRAGVGILAYGKEHTSPMASRHTLDEKVLASLREYLELRGIGHDTFADSLEELAGDIRQL